MEVAAVRTLLRSGAFSANPLPRHRASYRLEAGMIFGSAVYVGLFRSRFLSPLPLIMR